MNGPPQRIRDRQTLTNTTWVAILKSELEFQVSEIEKCSGEPLEVFRIVGDDCERLDITTDSTLRDRPDEVAIHAVTAPADRPYSPYSVISTETTWRPMLNLTITIHWLSPTHSTGLGPEVGLEGPNPPAAKPTVIPQPLLDSDVPANLFCLRCSTTLVLICLQSILHVNRCGKHVAFGTHQEAMSFQATKDTSLVTEAGTGHQRCKRCYQIPLANRPVSLTGLQHHKSRNSQIPELRCRPHGKVTQRPFSPVCQVAVGRIEQGDAKCRPECNLTTWDSGT